MTGRTRGARDGALLKATLAVLGEVGYDRLTTDAVALRAQASKATIYRRWPSKVELVAEAIQTVKREVENFPETGSFRTDLLEGVRDMMQRLASDEGRLFAAVIGASMRDTELAAILRVVTFDMKQHACRDVVDRAIARGELRSSATPDALISVLTAMLYFRTLTAAEQSNEAFLLHLVDDICMPVTVRS